MRLRHAFLIAGCLLAAAPASADDDKAGLRFILRSHPITRPAAREAPAPAHLLDQTNELKLAGTALLRFYQVFVSTQDIPSCPFTPTCSEYATQAVARYGLFAGAVMASDRYSRCHGCGLHLYAHDPATDRLIDPP